MPTTYAAAVKTARMESVRDEVAGGTIEVLSAADTVLAVFSLTALGGVIAGDIWTMAVTSATVSGTAAAGAGTNATAVQIKNSSGVVMISGLTVGAEVTLSNSNIADGQNVTFTSGQIQHASDPV